MRTVWICHQCEIGIDAEVLGWTNLRGVERAKWFSLRELVVRSAVVDHHDRPPNRELWCVKARINVGVRGNK